MQEMARGNPPAKLRFELWVICNLKVICGARPFGKAGAERFAADLEPIVTDIMASATRRCALSLPS